MTCEKDNGRVFSTTSYDNCTLPVAVLHVSTGMLKASIESVAFVAVNPPMAKISLMPVAAFFTRAHPWAARAVVMLAFFFHRPLK
jgi:hypothetical protein